jgi:D-sedoheptulose 7-phosphate isomerase
MRILLDWFIKMIDISDYIIKLSDSICKTIITRMNDQISLSDGVFLAMEDLKIIRDKKKILYIIGNGGSAAIASHVQNDLCKGLGVRAMVFNETPLLTAYANDICYQAAFEQMLKIWASPGDLLIAISSSGKSENILNAVKAAKELDCPVITFSGFTPENPLRKMGDLNFYVSSDEYGIVETAHATILHYLTDALKYES